MPLLHQTYRAGGNAQQQVHFLNFLLYFVPTSSIAPEEARSAVILGTTAKEEARLAAILGTTKCQCFHVFTLDL
jgi:hypothetical protein